MRCLRCLVGYKFGIFTCFIMALSIYIKLHGDRFDNGIIGTLRFKRDSSGNRSRGRVSEKIPFEEDFMFMSIAEDIDRSYSLHYDYYRESCPFAERIIGKAIRDVYNVTPSVAPSLIRLLFHDCFIEGCDASVLLDEDETLNSEKDASPNLSLKGFDVIDTIKFDLENVCPGVVSCSDILVLAAREAVLVAGGPFYPLETGRKDSAVAFKEIAQLKLPAPQSNLSVILASFASRGFDERETVCLFGAHSIGITHCSFFQERLYNFSGTGKPDPELNPGFLKELKTKCPFSASTASSPFPSPASDDSQNSYGLRSGNNKTDGVIDLSFNNEGGRESFGTRYYRRLMQKKGLLFSDQQLMGKETETWVRRYASDPVLFQRDFAMAMMKLSSYHVLTGPPGQVRRTCSQVMPTSD